MVGEQLRAPISLLQPSFPPELNCFNREGFHFFLSRQLAEARRYGYFTGYALFRLDTSDTNGLLGRVAQCLARNVRKTDFLGLLDDRTLGLILQHTTVRDAQGVLERLNHELSRFCPHREFSVIASAVAVFPTEANTLEQLEELAGTRLAGESTH
ncbi:MAG: hypothetical protein Kow00109_26950 [Acidobacteriota bacterium]